MTVEEAKEVIKQDIPCELDADLIEALHMAMASLEAWQKVRQDIQTETDDKSNNMYFNLGMLGALAIINKHLQKSEG